MFFGRDLKGNKIFAERADIWPTAQSLVNGVRIRIDVSENEDTDHPDLDFEMRTTEAMDLYRSLGNAIQDAGGDLDG